MIKAVWSLRLEGKILGVRVLTTYDKYFDIDIDVYRKQLKLDPSALKSLPLIEYGDLFMTEEEFNTGVLIEDASGNTGILNSVNTFIRENNEGDPMYQAKRRKKAEEISQKYYSYMPTQWLKEFGLYHLDTFEGNENIYTALNKDQVAVVKDYFRWRTKLIFDEQRASKVLRTKMNKARELVSLMGNATDWQYDGSVDTGYAGGSHCELGHALRYEHYAFSPSLSKQIIFGATCMSDFFELDKKVLDNITKAQEVLLKEIKSIVFIRQTGKQEEYAKDYSKELWDVLKHFKGQFNTKIPNGAGWSRFIGGFHKAGLPLTRSLLNKFQELYRQYKKELYDEEQDVETAKREQARLAREARERELEMKSEFARREAEQEQQAMRDKFEARQAIENGTNASSQAPSSRSDDGFDQIEAQLDEIERARDDGRLTGTYFAFTVIPTLRKTRKMSPRQKEFIDEALANIQRDDTPAPAPVKPQPEIQAPRVTEPPRVAEPPKPKAPIKAVDQNSTTVGKDGVDYGDIF